MGQLLLHMRDECTPSQCTLIIFLSNMVANEHILLFLTDVFHGMFERMRP